MSPHRGRLAIRLLVPAVIAAASLALLETDWTWRLDLVAYDFLLRRPAGPAPADVVLVAIDERSLDRLGRWPWPREVHAELIDRLTAAGVRVVALDIAFTEPDEDDDRLATTLRESARVVLPVLHEQVGVEGAPVESLPVPVLSQTAAGLGHVDVEVDPDGMVRTIYLEAGLGRPAWPHLALALLRVAGEAPAIVPGETDPDAAPAAPYFWARNHRVLVPFGGPPGHFRRVSYADVVSGQVPEDRLRGAFVLVGPTATGLGDQVPTPVSGLDRPMSGIEFNAHVLEALRRGTTVQYLPMRWTRVLTGVLVFAVSVALMFVRRQTLAALAALAGVLAVSAVTLLWFARWFTPTPAIAGILLAFPLAAWRERLHLVARERARADVALGSLAEGVITAGADLRIDYLNPVAAAWLGGTAAIGQTLGSVLRVASDQDPVSAILAGPALDGTPVDATLITGGGQRVLVRASIVAIGGRDEPHHGLAVALLLRDAAEPAPATDGNEASSESPETVTRAPARARIEAQLAMMIADAGRTGRHVAVLVLDIARLRHVNVALGRRGGDALLTAVAERLRGAIREREAVAHVGGDEFVILLDELTRPEDVVGMASRLVKVFDAPFSIEGVEVRARTCIGVSLYREHGGDAETLLLCAETAKSWARDYGQGPVQVYAPHMSTPALDRIVLERALQAALEGDQLDLVYQPQVEIASGAIVAAEALVRWRHPQHGPIPTTTFIALAEETQLIVGLGEWVLRAACRQLAEWRARGLPPMRVAVNVSPRQMLEPGLPEVVERAVRDFALDPSLLEIEITESVLVRDMERTGETLSKIKAMGIGVTLDDFGVGYSSLEYLSRLPVDSLKIDRSFVTNVSVNGHDRTICLAVLAMAQSMRRRVIAEGVETIDQVRFFASKGCDLIQGHFVSRPIDAAEMARLIRDGIRFPTT
jgi:diguanylate cyclase (GGDEF)-like protein